MYELTFPLKKAFSGLVWGCLLKRAESGFYFPGAGRSRGRAGLRTLSPRPAEGGVEPARQPG